MKYSPKGSHAGTWDSGRGVAGSCCSVGTASLRCSGLWPHDWQRAYPSRIRTAHVVRSWQCGQSPAYSRTWEVGVTRSQASRKRCRTFIERVPSGCRGSPSENRPAAIVGPAGSSGASIPGTGPRSAASAFGCTTLTETEARRSTGYRTVTESASHRGEPQDRAASRALRSRNSCTSFTVIEPSPTADATRLIDPRRTSPAVRMPGRFVSRKCGLQSGGNSAGALSRAVPANTNPFSPSATGGSSPSGACS